MRKPYVAGNWKMNLDRRSALELVARIRDHVGTGRGVDVGVFPPAVYLEEVARACAGTPLVVGGQNLCDQESGAYTGEVSGAMLRDVGATSVLVGHSERRHVYGETDALVNAKVRRALASGLDVVLCLGELIEERQAGRTEEVCSRQLTEGLRDVPAGDLARVTLAYEPVWAIGTGHTATPEQAGQVHAYVRGVLGGLYSDGAAQAVRILYGGSVKPSNARELMAVADIDGALVGGASLEPESFLPILDQAV